MRKRFSIPLPGGGSLEAGTRTLVVAILNVTPDSFSDGGRSYDSLRAIDRALELEAEGADVLEVGGESTRPGAEPVPAAEELSRIIPVIEGLRGRLHIPIAVDTYKSEVAREALAAGAGIINDVYSLGFDPRLAEVTASAGAALVLMHMRGTPADMQKIPPSPDIFAEMESVLLVAARKAEAAGVQHDQIILDPGVGFGKTAEQNLAIIKHLDRLSGLGYPVMLGTSRKGFIGRLTGRVADERVLGSVATVAIGIDRGAHFVRVHDVKETVEVVKVVDAILTVE